MHARWRAALCLAAMLATTAAGASTIEAIKERGEVVCGVSQDAPGLSEITSSGAWKGMEIDTCRALAAAVLGDAGRAKFRPLTASQRFAALKNREIDVLARNERTTMSSDVEPGITFAATLLHSSLAVMVPRRLTVASVRELSGQRLCVAEGSDADALALFLASRNMTATPVVSDSMQRMLESYKAQHCAGIVADAVLLAATRLRLARADTDTILADRLSIQPVGLMVRTSDEAWQAVVRWVVNALLAGEMHGAGTAAKLPLPGPDGETKGLKHGLAGSEGMASTLGLPKTWLAAVLGQVGNYREIYERNLGAGSPLNVPRGANALWSEGGLFVPAPFR